MRDPRVDKLAQVLVNYSVKVQPGQLVRITGDQVGTPLLEAVYEAVLQAGGHPLLRCGLSSCQDIFLQSANEDQLQYVNPVNLAEVEHIDASIGLWADVNTKSLSRVDSKKLAMKRVANGPIMDRFLKRAADGELRWCGTLFPTLGSAQDAEMSLAQGYSEPREK